VNEAYLLAPAVSHRQRRRRGDKGVEVELTYRRSVAVICREFRLHRRAFPERQHRGGRQRERKSRAVHA